ncbi:GntR family transcriptional regulator [Bacillus piscicola]|uniref:GntR family transcriptional regulator n=1 Tax=Bacillus piscicola TaxID=1632684 RepID=UPI001F09B437|nr:GntR family transcriptional regulator [Bacillus piscicola]
MNVNVKKSSLKYQIAEAVRKEIFRGVLKPGDKVTETVIAQKFEVSRGPVREAMQILVMEGLLVSTTFKETRVSQITTEEVTDLLVPMRVNLETFALKKGFPSWNKELFQQFDDILEKMRRASIFDDLPLFNDVDIQFHELIVLSSKMNNVVHLWESILNRIRLHFIYQNSLSDDLHQYTEDHRVLLDSFKSGDVDAAVKQLEDHLIKTNKTRAELLPDLTNTSQNRE